MIYMAIAYDHYRSMFDLPIITERCGDGKPNDINEKIECYSNLSIIVSVLTHRKIVAYEGSRE